MCELGGELGGEMTLTSRFVEDHVLVLLGGRAVLRGAMHVLTDSLTHLLPPHTHTHHVFPPHDVLSLASVQAQYLLCEHRHRTLGGGEWEGKNEYVALMVRATTKARVMVMTKVMTMVMVTVSSLSYHHCPMTLLTSIN